MDPSTLRQAQGGRGRVSGTLFVVATPIGNLEDVTLRALRVLREVAVVAAEDTRRTGHLLRHYQIPTRLISLHAHNERWRIAPLVERLSAGESVALVSDAGTPGISDPGAQLVSAARRSGIRVEPIPGPSAVTAALSASGFSFERFAFAGFPPIRSNDRKNWWAWVSSLADVPVVCFEAPHRIRGFLSEARRILAERPILIAREMTKAHEELLEAPHEVPERGEFVVVFGRKTEINRLAETPSDAEIATVFSRFTKNGGATTRRGVLKAVAEELGIPVNSVYEALERTKRPPA